MATISATSFEELGKHHIAREHTLLLEPCRHLELGNVQMVSLAQMA